MSLLTVSRMQKLTDKLGITYERLLAACGSSAGSVAVGTWRNLATNAQTILSTDFDDLPEQIDLGPTIYDLANAANVEAVVAASTALKAAVNAIPAHCKLRGAGVDASIIGLATWIAYYNGGSGGNRFSSMLHPSFGVLYNLVTSQTLSFSGLFHPGIHPDLDATNYPNGFGRRAVGGSFVAGATASYATYEPPVPYIEVITTFSGGGANPTVLIAGTDHTGASDTTWSVDLGSNNPSATISTTLGADITGDSVGSRLLADSTGIAVGSTITIGAGTATQETSVVTAVADGTHATFECRKAHTSGDAVTCKRTVALTPTVSGRRIRSVSNITLTLSSHAAGAVRIVGMQERMGNPVS